jgi:hypothetical protein
VVREGAAGLAQLARLAAVLVSMRGATAAGVGLVTAMAFAATAPARAVPPHNCGPRSAETVRSNKLVRVYLTEDGRYHACARRPGGDRYSLGRLQRVLLRGPYVTSVGRYCNGRCAAVDVTDIVRGEAVAHAESPGAVRRVVATRRGEAAVMFASPDGSERFILKLDSLGTSELDRGAELGRLRVSGSRLHWLKDGRERSSPAAHTRRCGPEAGVDSVALGRDVRVYSRYREPKFSDEELVEYFACLRPGGKPFEIAQVDVAIESTSADTDDEVQGLVFSGRYVAFALVRCGIFGCDSTVSVFDVRGRRRVRSENFNGSAVTVVVSPTGHAAALVSYVDGADDPPDAAVFKVGHGNSTRLDRGPEVRELTLDGSILHWLNGSEQRSAPLG